MSGFGYIKYIAYLCNIKRVVNLLGLRNILTKTKIKL